MICIEFVAITNNGKKNLFYKTFSAKNKCNYTYSSGENDRYINECNIFLKIMTFCQRVLLNKIN